MTSVRHGIILVLTLIASSSAFAQVVITPSTPPAVNQGGTYTFTANVPVTWSCPGCAGSIDPSTGVYQAPAVVNSHQSLGGCQLLPNDHILNTRIDSLPVNLNSAAWTAVAPNIAWTIYPTVPLNYVNNATPTQNIVFQYSPANNGAFALPTYPTGSLQSGWLSDPLATDHHMYAIDTNMCNFLELYDLYAIGANSSAPLTNSVSGAQYLGSTYVLPIVPGSGSSGSDAAGMNMMAMVLHLPEMENALATGGTIKHALRVTLRNIFEDHTNYLWPAAGPEYSGSGVVPFGARFRLKASFDISSYSPIAKIILTALKQYGMMHDDGGVDWSSAADYVKWPKAYTDAFNEIGITKQIHSSDFEAVDESSLMVSSSSGVTTASESVVATSISDPSKTARQQVVLTGVTIGLPNDSLTIQVGTAAQQFTAFVHGTSSTGVTWSMNPAAGTLTSGGLYTPPSNVTSETSTVVTATSVANPNVVAVMTLTILPAGPIHIVMCDAAAYANRGWSWPYTDSRGNVWQSQTGDNGGISFFTTGSIPPWPNTPDIRLYMDKYVTGDTVNDMRFDVIVPNGIYNIVAKFAENYYSSANQALIDLESQGTVRYSNVDLFTAAGGEYKPVDFTLPATVTNGHLVFVIRSLTGEFTGISALEIDPVAGPSNGSSAQPAPPTGLSIIVQ